MSNTRLKTFEPRSDGSIRMTFTSGETVTVTVDQLIKQYAHPKKQHTFMWLDEQLTIDPEVFERIMRTVPKGAHFYSSPIQRGNHIHKLIEQYKQREANLIPVTFTNAKKYDKRSIDSLSIGDIVMNAYHDPENPHNNAGLYMVIADPTYAKREDCLFVVDIRSGSAYGYNYMKRRTTDNHASGGVYMVDMEGFTASIRRAV